MPTVVYDFVIIIWIVIAATITTISFRQTLRYRRRERNRLRLGVDGISAILSHQAIRMATTRCWYGLSFLLAGSFSFLVRSLLLVRVAVSIAFVSTALIMIYSAVLDEIDDYRVQRKIGLELDKDSELPVPARVTRVELIFRRILAEQDRRKTKGRK